MADRYDAESPSIKLDIAEAMAAINEPVAEVVSRETETILDPDAVSLDSAEKPESANAGDDSAATGTDDAAKETAEAGAKDDAKDAKDGPAQVEPPSNWSADDKAKFKAAPAELQSWLLDRHKSMEADYTKKTQEIAAFRTEYSQVDKIFDPWREQMKQSGFTPSTLIRAWANVEQQLMAGNGVKILSEVARSYKVNPAQLASALGIAAPVAQPAPDTASGAAPAIAATVLPPEVKAELDGLRERLDTRERSEVLAKINQINSEIESFRTATDDKGSLLHPHWEAALKDIEALAEASRISGQKTNLQELYDKAVWANPSLRETILSEQTAAASAKTAAAQQATEKKVAEEARAKAAKAKKAGSSVTGSPGTGQAQQRNGVDRSLKDELRAQLAEQEAAA